MKTQWNPAFTVYGFLVLSVSGLAFGVQNEEHKATALPDCPVMGETVNLAVSVPTEDGPVFFCCRGCDRKYKANTAKFAEAVAAQRKALAGRPTVQVKCPVSGEPVDSNVFVEKDRRKIGFCCKDCVAQYEADPAKYKSALANSYTFQTRCPVTGEGINPNTSVKLPDGEVIYTCSKGCISKLIAEPGKFTPNLETQGYSFDPAKIAKGTEGEAEHEDDDDEHGHDHHDHDHE